MVKDGSIESQATLPKFAKSKPELRVLHDRTRRTMRYVAVGRFVRIIERNLTDAMKPIRCPVKRAVQVLADGLSKTKVRVPHDGRADAAITIVATCGHRTDAVRKLDLAQRPKYLGAVGSCHCLGFNIDSCNDAMAGTDVGQVIIE